MIQKTPSVLLMISLVTALLAAGLWYREHRALQASRAEILSGELQPIATLLQENEVIIHVLSAEPFAEKDSGILVSYLAQIRRDGIERHVDMKQRLETLAENSTAIEMLIKAHASYAKTPSFNTEADKFRNYASAWRDRWNSVMELFMSGGNYPASDVPFPRGFPSAVEAEIAAMRP
jgi:hypothetical protein